jgi:hypothetical protein
MVSETVKKHRTRGKVYRHPPSPATALEELDKNENFSDNDSSSTGLEIKRATDKHRAVRMSVPSNTRVHQMSVPVL